MRLFLPFLFLSLLLLGACAENTRQPDETDASATLYHNGDILTMEGNSAEYAEAVVVVDGKITFVGAKAEAEKEAGAGYAEVNLAGQTLLPGFIDAHSHFISSLSVANQLNLYPPPSGPGKDVDAIDAGLRPTNHTDFVVAPLDQPFMLWSAVNRISRSGEVIGEDQRVTPYEGLQAMTINVAHQYQEEELKGSIKTGKLADFVILDQNPLKVAPDAIKDIQVMETIKEGETVYRKGNDALGMK